MNKLKRTLALILSAALLAAVPASAIKVDDAAAMRGVWVSSVYNLDYPSEQTTDAAALKAEADAILDDCEDWGMNAVFLQVRPTSDALYDSDIFPWSRWLTGNQGEKPKGNFDPLEYWVEEAHKRGIELHAWINPYRITRAGAADWDHISSDNPAAAHPEWVIEHEGNYYYDPGLPAVRELVIDGAVEIAKNYDVDGIHLDDYFYPGSDFADDATYARYGDGETLSDWRRENVNLLVEGLHKALQKYDLEFGISPSGIWANQATDPRGSATGGAQIHNHTDNMDRLDPDSFMITLNFVALFADQLANAPVNPIPRKLADSVMEKLEEGKKMRAAAEAKDDDKKDDKKDDKAEEKKETEDKK